MFHHKPHSCCRGARRYHHLRHNCHHGGRLRGLLILVPPVRPGRDDTYSSSDANTDVADENRKTAPVDHQAAGCTTFHSTTSADRISSTGTSSHASAKDSGCSFLSFCRHCSLCGSCKHSRSQSLQVLLLLFSNSFLPGRHEGRDRFFPGEASECGELLLEGCGGVLRTQT